MMMRNLLQSFYSLYAGSPLAAALTGGFYHGAAPQGTACPYGVYRLTNYKHRDFSLDDASITVHLYSAADLATEITNLHDLLIDLYDGKLLAGPLVDHNLGLDLAHFELLPPMEPETFAWTAITVFDAGVARS